MNFLSITSLSCFSILLIGHLVFVLCYRNHQQSNTVQSYESPWKKNWIYFSTVKPIENSYQNKIKSYNLQKETLNYKTSFKKQKEKPVNNKKVIHYSPPVYYKDEVPETTTLDYYYYEDEIPSTTPPPLIPHYKKYHFKPSKPPVISQTSDNTPIIDIDNNIIPSESLENHYSSKNNLRTQTSTSLNTTVLPEPTTYKNEINTTNIAFTESLDFSTPTEEYILVSSTLGPNNLTTGIDLTTTATELSSLSATEKTSDLTTLVETTPTSTEFSYINPKERLVTFQNVTITTSSPTSPVTVQTTSSPTSPVTVQTTSTVTSTPSTVTSTITSSTITSSTVTPSPVITSTVTPSIYQLIENNDFTARQIQLTTSPVPVEISPNTAIAPIILQLVYIIKALADKKNSIPILGNSVDLCIVNSPQYGLGVCIPQNSLPIFCTAHNLPFQQGNCTADTMCCYREITYYYPSGSQPLNLLPPPLPYYTPSVPNKPPYYYSGSSNFNPPLLTNINQLKTSYKPSPAILPPNLSPDLKVVYSGGNLPSGNSNPVPPKY